ncbi:methyltransferase small [Ignisphaera aggregans DSM 17230]|uniref:Methyltransferase small n=1 Tax=Ignisphaera aggregans (strain DSM 17230 / JCM 13409 / AQ1.S1) TaxID=583356 RepID=E0SQ79_IGNAA|nr:methyltransferase small [Ignisphaera aggregans DSM 17230]
MEHYYVSKKNRSSQYMLISDYIRGLTVEFEVIPGLFSYRQIDEGTRLLIENLEIPSEGRVLDLGCGYGAIGIVVALLNPKLEVYMVDINREAVRLAERNVIRNKIDPQRIKIFQGNLYEPVKDILFNAIYSNPPYSAGSQVIEELITQAPQHLKTAGIIQIVARKGAEKVYKLMKETFGNVETVASKRGYKVFKSYKE